jgi:IS4 transposase
MFAMLFATCGPIYAQTLPTGTWRVDVTGWEVVLKAEGTALTATSAAIYKDRWQIELFFKAIKQSLRIKTFIGTSENAVQTQIWTALIAMLVVRYLQLRSTWNWGLSNLVALLRQHLFVYRDLAKWLTDPFEPPLALQESQLPLALT